MSSSSTFSPSQSVLTSAYGRSLACTALRGETAVCTHTLASWYCPVPSFIIIKHVRSNACYFACPISCLISAVLAQVSTRCHRLACVSGVTDGTAADHSLAEPTCRSLLQTLPIRFMHRHTWRAGRAILADWKQVQVWESIMVVQRCARCMPLM